MDLSVEFNLLEQVLELINQEVDLLRNLRCLRTASSRYISRILELRGLLLQSTVEDGFTFGVEALIVRVEWSSAHHRN